MIKAYEIKLYCPERPLHYLWGYNLYGALMERMSPDFAQELHEQKLTPISQYLETVANDKYAVWHVNLLNEKAVNHLESVLKNMEEINLDPSRVKIQVISIHEAEAVTPVSLLVRPEIEGERTCTMEFLTPAAFRSDNKYQVFPLESLLVNNLIQKWNMAFPESPFQDDDMERMLVQGLVMKKYRMKTLYYKIKKGRIPGFVGSATWEMRLSASLKNAWKLLWLFSEYSGVGIKTSLGMGGVRLKMEAEREE